MPKSTRKWHRNSIFGDGPRVRLDREQRAQWKAKLQLQRRPGRLTIGSADVGRALCNMLGNDGRLDPSHATIAVRSGVHISTVKRALEQLAEFGFLSWTRRLIRRAWRCEQTTSAYVLMTPRAAPLFNAPSLKSNQKDLLAQNERRWRGERCGGTRWPRRCRGSGRTVATEACGGGRTHGGRGKRDTIPVCTHSATEAARLSFVPNPSINPPGRCGSGGLFCSASSGSGCATGLTAAKVRCSPCSRLCAWFRSSHLRCAPWRNIAGSGRKSRREDRTGKWFLASQTEKNGALNEAWRSAFAFFEAAIDATACGDVERVSATADCGQAQRVIGASVTASRPPFPCPAEPEQGLGPPPLKEPL